MSEFYSHFCAGCGAPLAATAETNRNENQLCGRCHALRYKNKLEETVSLHSTFDFQRGKSVAAVVARTNENEAGNDNGSSGPGGGGGVGGGRSRHSSLYIDGGEEIELLLCVDLFHFESSMPSLSEIVDAIGEDEFDEMREIALVCNKIDILPSDLKASRVERWLRAQLKARSTRLNERVTKIILTSAKNGQNIHAVRQWVNRADAAKNIVIAGRVNAGKSTLCNQLMAKEGNGGRSRARIVHTQQRSERAPSSSHSHTRAASSPTPAAQTNAASTTLPLVTASSVPHTTRGPIVRMLPPTHSQSSSRRRQLIDLPGFAAPAYVDDALLTYLSPSKRLAFKTYRVMPGSSLLLGALIRIDVLKTSSTNHQSPSLENQSQSSLDSHGIAGGNSTSAAFTANASTAANGDYSRAPAFFTVFASPAVTRHVTRTERAADTTWLRTHADKLLFPSAPLLRSALTLGRAANINRLRANVNDNYGHSSGDNNATDDVDEALGALAFQRDADFDLRAGRTWKRNVFDIVLPAIGFVAVAMRGSCQLRTWHALGAQLRRVAQPGAAAASANTSAGGIRAHSPTRASSAYSSAAPSVIVGRAETHASPTADTDNADHCTSLISHRWPSLVPFSVAKPTRKADAHSNT